MPSNKSEYQREYMRKKRAKSLTGTALLLHRAKMILENPKNPKAFAERMSNVFTKFETEQA